MKLVCRSASLIALIFLVSCGKEPTEIQKAQLEPMLIGCTMAVNPTSLDDANVFSALARLGNLSGITNKEWSLNDAETVVTASFSSDTTDFECDFMQNQEAEWVTEKVRRNGEEVYDRATADAKLAELKEEEKVKQEAERLERKKKEEEERLAEISKWREKGYSNVAYKFYAKYPSTWNKSKWNSPELRIVCHPDYPRFQLDDSQVRMKGRPGVEFQFVDRQGKITKTFIDLTSSGTAGEAYESMIGEDVRTTKQNNAEAIKIMKASDSVEVAGMTFTIDDLNPIPCI